MSELDDMALEAATTATLGLLSQLEAAEASLAIAKQALEDILNVTGDPVTIAHTALGRISLRSKNL